MCGSNNRCQIEAPSTFSRLKNSRLWIKLYRLRWHIRTDGLRWTFAWIARSTARRVPGVRGFHEAAKPRVRRACTDEILNLQPGEWVEVKSEQEIAQTLDEHRKFRGLVFLPEMRLFCGRRFPVYKRLEIMFMEESQQTRSVKNTVLLSGAVCEGAGYGCDRSCLFYWREVWLRRVDLPPAATVERG